MRYNPYFAASRRKQAARLLRLTALLVISLSGTSHVRGQGLPSAMNGPNKVSTIGVFRGQPGQVASWIVDSNGDHQWQNSDRVIYFYGNGGDYPVLGEWNDNSGQLKMGVFHDGYWYLDLNGSGIWEPGLDNYFGWGQPGDVPVVGDWKHDGKLRIGVYRLINGYGWWYVNLHTCAERNGYGCQWGGEHGADSEILGVDYEAYQYGGAGDIPVVGDWDHTGTLRIGVFRSGQWIVDLTGCNCFNINNPNTFITYSYGQGGDKPAVGRWTGASDAANLNIGVFRSGQWIVDGNGDRAWEQSDPVYSYGASGDIPVVGSWATTPPPSMLPDPTWLEGTLGFVPFPFYDYSHAPSSLPNYTKNCPPGSPSIRSCFQQILHDMRAQGVSGVRIYITFCDDNHGPLTGCGAQVSWNPNSDPAKTWIAHAGDFFQDVLDAGIPRVTISADLGNASTWSISVPTGSTHSVSGPNAPICSDYTRTHTDVKFSPGFPYGLNTDNSYPISQDNNDSYNCAPVNPYFLGWNNYLSVIDAALGAAQGKVTVSELEGQQEVNLVAFTAELRLIYDNASADSALPNPTNCPAADILCRLRKLMTNHYFDPGRVTWSAPWDDATADPQCPLPDTTYGTGTCNCLNVWGDYARQSNLDAIYSAIGMSYVGVPINSSAYGINLSCGGTTDSLFLAPMYNTQPTIVDSHMYPSTLGGTSDQYVQQAAALDYTDLVHFFTLPCMQSALVMIGETHDFRVCPDYPPNAPYSNAAGFNQASLYQASINQPFLTTGRSVVIRPFMNLGGSCSNNGPTSYPYGPSGSQNLNYNWNGPYNPSRFN